MSDFGVIIVILIFQLLVTVVCVILVLMINQKKMIKTTLQALGKEGTPLLGADPKESQRANETIMAGLQSIEQKLQQQEVQLQQLNYIKENLGSIQTISKPKQATEIVSDIMPTMPEILDVNEIADVVEETIKPMQEDELAANELEKMLDEDTTEQLSEQQTSQLNYKVKVSGDDEDLLHSETVRELVPRHRKDNNLNQKDDDISSIDIANQNNEPINTDIDNAEIGNVNLGEIIDSLEDTQDFKENEHNEKLQNINQSNEETENIDFGNTENIEQLQSESEINMEEEAPIIEEIVEDASVIKPQKREIKILDDDELDEIGSMSPEERMARIMEEQRKEIGNQELRLEKKTEQVSKEFNQKNEQQESNEIEEKNDINLVPEEQLMIEEIKAEPEVEIIATSTVSKKESEEKTNKNILEEKVKEAKSVLKAKELQKITEKPIEEMNIVIVDDTRIMRTILKKMIEEKGYKNILEVESGNKAIELCNNNKDIDLMIIDAEMPELDGISTMKEILKQNKNLKILISSSIADETRINSFKEQGAVEFISKPFEQKMVVESINKALKK